MRTLSPLALEVLSNTQGLEPIIVIGIQWTDTLLLYYADQEIENIAPGVIIDVANIEDVTKFDGSGTSSNLSVTMDDTNLIFKPYFDTIDIHKRPAYVYQSFKGLPFGDSFLLYQGEITSPIVWAEGDRTFKFDIISTLDFAEIGFTPEEGIFPNLPYDQIGKSWPLVFGTVVHVPGVTYQVVPKASTTVPVGAFYYQVGNEWFQDFYNAQRDLLDSVQLKYFATFWLNNALVAGLAGDDAEAQASNIKSAEYQLQYAQKLKDAAAKVLAGTQAQWAASAEFQGEAGRFNGSPRGTVSQIGIQGLFHYFYWTVTQDPSGNRSTPVFAGYTQTSSALLGTPGVNPLNPTLNVISQNEVVLTTDLIVDGTYTIILLRTPNNIAPTGTDHYYIGQQTVTKEIPQLIFIDGKQIPDVFTVPNQNRAVTPYSTVFGLMQGILVVNAIGFPQDRWLDCLVGGREMSVFFTNLNPLNGEAIAYFKDLEIPTFNLLPFMNQTILNAVASAASLQPMTQGSANTTNFNPQLPYTVDFSFSDISTYDAIQPNDPVAVGANAIPNYSIPIVSQQFKNLIIEAGTQISLLANGTEPTSATLDYIVDINPSTVNAVFAYRTVGGLRTLMQVPPSYYTIMHNTYGSVTNTVVELKYPLSAYDGEDWEDQIYATVTSSIASNTVYQLIYLIETYTDHGWDQASFALAAEYVTNYPSNFVITSRVNIIQALNDIAYQARCAIYLKADSFFIKFLPAIDTIAKVITEDDIILQSMTISCDDTTKLITKYIAQWHDTAIDKGPNLIVLRNNQYKYGIIEETYDYYIYNNQDTVLAAATFWMIRKSNTFKLLTIKVPLTMLALETYDTIYLNFRLPWIATDPNEELGNQFDSRAIVLNCKYSTTDQTCELDLWLPILYGTMVHYAPAFPFNLPESFILASQYQQTGGHTISRSIASLAIGTIPLVLDENALQVPDPNGIINSLLRNQRDEGVPDSQNVATLSDGRQIQYGASKFNDMGLSQPSAAALLGPPVNPINYSTASLTKSAALPPGQQVAPVVTLSDQVTKADLDAANKSLLAQIQTVANGASGGGGSGGGGIPGYVQEFLGFTTTVALGDLQTYRVTTYPTGATGPSSSVTAFQLQLDTPERIVAGTAVEVVSITNPLGQKEFYMQVPVWTL